MADRFAALEAEGLSRAEIARRHGLTRARVSQLLALLDLDPAVLAHVRAGSDCPSARWLTRLARFPPRSQRVAIELLSAGGTGRP